MKRITGLMLAIVLLLGMTQVARAQNQRDFASQFMRLYAQDDASLKCQTVSPLMVERIMNLEAVENNENIKAVMGQLKSIQILTSVGAENSEDNYQKAIALAETNNRRYQLYKARERGAIYLRRRKNVIVELVFVNKSTDTFHMVNLTGNMTEDFIDALAKI